MAVAGFAEAELNVTQKENELLVTGQSAPNADEGKQYLYRGIAGRNFERRFQLADHVKVSGCEARQRPAARSSCSARSRRRRRPVRSRSRPGGQAGADALTLMQ